MEETYNVGISPLDCVTQIQRPEHDDGQMGQVDGEAQPREWDKH